MGMPIHILFCSHLWHTEMKKKTKIVSVPAIDTAWNAPYRVDIQILATLSISITYI